MFPATQDILMKFHFPQKVYVPTSIPYVSRLDTPTMDSLHAAKNPEKGNLGRHRQGRVDTGEPCFGRWGLQNVEVSMLKRALHVAGYSVNDIHWFEKEFRGRPQYVVCITFKHKSKGEPKAELESEQREALEALASFNWGQVHVWDNTKTQSDNYTVNCTSLMEGKCAPEGKLSLRRGGFVQLPVSDPDMEMATA